MSKQASQHSQVESTAPAQSAATPRHPTTMPPVRFASVTALTVSLTIFVVNLWKIRFFPSLSTDSLVYHLTIPAKWTQIGAFQKFDIPLHDGTAIHSPLITESIIYLLMAWTGNDALAWLVQPAFFLFTVWLYYRILRLLGLNEDNSRLLTALFCLFTPFFRSAQIVNSEMAMTCGIAIFCYGTLIARNPKRPGGFLIAAAGIALAFSAKTVAVLYASPATVLLFTCIHLRSPSDDSTKRQRWRISPVAAVIILVGLAFHLRNLWQYGNPLYPADVRILGIHILAGLYDTSVFTNHDWKPTHLIDLFLHDTETFALRLHVALFLWCGLLYTGYCAWRGRLSPKTQLAPQLFVVLPVICSLLYLLVTPFWAEHRLLYPVYFLLWGGVGSSLALLQGDGRQSWTIGISRVLIVAYVLYAFVFLLFDEVSFYAIGAALVAGVFIANFPKLTHLLARALPAAPILLVGGLLISSPWWFNGYVQERRGARAHFYPIVYGATGKAWNLIEELTSDRPATVAYAGTALIYPLFGNRLENHVVYLPLSPDDRPQSILLNDAELIYLQLARQRRQSVDAEYWLQQLKHRAVDYLLLVDDPALGGVSPELDIASQHPDLLSRIFVQEGVSVYRVRR